MADTFQEGQGARGGTKYEQHMYYRRPKGGENSEWIINAGNNMERQHDLILRGFTPLPQYGTIEEHGVRLRRANMLLPDEPLNPWRPILDHPNGPIEFPADQIMQLRWYKDEHCPVPGTKFPQLGGHSIREYQCPECHHLPFAAQDGVGGIEPLGRHLRVIHSWDRASLVKYGEKVGLDFDAIYSSIKVDFNFDGEKKAKSSGFDCPDCDWTPKANAKRPAVALEMHSKVHEFTMEEATA